VKLSVQQIFGVP